MICHTEACGFSASVCPECGQISVHFGSCNNACCPEGGAVRREKWIDVQRSRLINARYFHIIFTVPAVLNDLFLADQSLMGSVLFKAHARALKRISADPKYFGAADCGFFTVEHTWGSNLYFHPHLHTLFVAAGMDKEGNLVYPKYLKKRGKKYGKGKRGKEKSDYLFPAKKLASLFREIFLKEAGKHLDKLGAFGQTALAKAKKQNWNVEICSSSNNAKTVITYLSRYMNRSAISNGRIISYDGENVTFRYKPYKDDGALKTCTLSDKEFLRRFVQHIPPEGLRRIRHCGFLGQRSRDKLERMKKLTNTLEDFTPRITNQILEEKLGKDFWLCKKCQSKMVSYAHHEQQKMSSNERLKFIKYLERTIDLSPVERVEEFIKQHKID